MAFKTPYNRVKHKKSHKSSYRQKYFTVVIMDSEVYKVEKY